MISVIDTNILPDIFLPDPLHGESSLKLLKTACEQGSLIICDIIYAEFAHQFHKKDLLDEAL